MDQGTGTSQARPAAKVAIDAAVLLAWPAAVQLAVAMIVTASVFFFLGRWSQEWSRAETPPIAAREVAGRAIDLNLATRAELRLLPGLGEALAQRVIERRQNVGPFRSVDELRKVSGIGPKTLERLRPHLYVIPPDETFVSLDEGEIAPPEPKMAGRPPASGGKASKLTGPINVNRADQAELQKLPGIGPKISQRILDERARGSFKSVEELRRVSGIGPKTLEKLRPFVTIE